MLCESGTLVKRYLKDLDREEDDLIATRKRTEELEEEATALKRRAEAIRQQAATGAQQLLDELRAL